MKNKKNPNYVVALFLITILILMSAAAASSSKLKVGFYEWTCPNAEWIVRSVVNQAIASDPGIGAGLIRLHFHDCFVRGCDASVLIAPTSSNPTERSSPINLSLRGFEVIDQAKAQLEAACPGIVSCADIVAFAARDSALKLGNINYNVPSGRRDGTISLQSDPLTNLPLFTMTLSQLESTFSAKGLSVNDMVVLSGAHSIGLAHCSSFTNRLYPTVDPTLNPTFAAGLLSLCPSNTSTNNPTTNLEYRTPNVLDNKYYKDILNRRVLLTSDKELRDSASTLRLVNDYAEHGGTWGSHFAASIQKMGNIGVVTGTKGEIRKVCSAFN